MKTNTQRIISKFRETFWAPIITPAMVEQWLASELEGLEEFYKQERSKEIIEYLNFQQRMIETHPETFTDDEWNLVETIKEKVSENIFEAELSAGRKEGEKE
jgi:hypothetical protein